MATPRDLIRARLSKTRNELQEALDHIDPNLMGWAPADGMRTVGGQLVEIGVTELGILVKMRDDREVVSDDVRNLLGLQSLSDQELLGKLEHPGEIDTLTKLLNRVRESTLAYLESLTDDQLEEEIPITTWHMTINLPHMPRAEVFRNIAQHESYHTGQLVSYLWANGDNPYRW